MRRRSKPKQTRAKFKNWIIGIGLAVVLATVGLGALGLGGFIQLNNPSTAEYPVRGVDVSSYQGEIDWPTLSAQGIDFAYLKATEGSTFVDSRFSQNWDGAQTTALRVGAYHFFSFESPGTSQAAHFIDIVPNDPTALPPMVDLEWYDAFVASPPDAASVIPELSDLLEALTEHYGKTPVIYATAETYHTYLSQSFEHNDIWIRDIIREPTLSDGRDWTFWQYSARGRLPGFQGSESFIDLNVFAGTKADFASY
jgi:lysozyme